MGHVNIAAGTKVQGILSFDNISKNNLKMCILENMESNSGLLLWVSSYCISCIFQEHCRKGIKFYVLTYDDVTEPTQKF